MRAAALALGLALLLPAAGRAAPPAPTSSAEFAEGDGLAAYALLKAVSVKDGKRFVEVDYVELLSAEECRRRVQSGRLAWDLDDCEVDPRVVNDNPKLRRFEVSGEVRILKRGPDGPARELGWDELVGRLGGAGAEAKELREGLWKVVRRGEVVERLEWIWLD